MEFAATSSASSAASKKPKKKKNNKKKKSNSNKNNTQQNSNDNAASNAEELAAFLHHLEATDDDDEEEESHSQGSPSAWAADRESEETMSANFVKSLSAHDHSGKVLEAEFLRQFRTHLAWKKYLSGTEAKVLKDRVFMLMAKEQEAAQAGDTTQQILYGHFLYEELRLQHEFLTTPQDSDTPNDTAFKVTMVPIICGIIRNCNNSRDSICLNIKDDDEECEALFKVPLAPRGSCLTSVLRPLYREIKSKHVGIQGTDSIESSGNLGGGDSESEGENDGSFKLINALSPDLQVLCCGGENRTNGVKNNKYFEGPPEWHHNLPFFMKRIKYSSPTPERMGFVKHALRKAQEIRVMQDQLKFYGLAYGNASLHASSIDENESKAAESLTTLTLPFSTHVMLHRACNAVVCLKASSSQPADSELMTLPAFKRLVTIKVPRLLVSPCSRCHIPCTGECVCGASYCSAACLEADQCRGCSSGCCQELKYLTPVAWGRAPLDL